jgi:hypothetical protein
METQTKATPESFVELAQAVSELANHIERVTEGQPDEKTIVNRMLADGANEYVAAFHSLTYSWILAVMPELEPILSLDAKDYHRRWCWNGATVRCGTTPTSARASSSCFPIHSAMSMTSWLGGRWRRDVESQMRRARHRLFECQ